MGQPMRGVEIFRAGRWKGKTYTERDLDQIVDNFNRYQSGTKALQKAPLVVGHDDDDLKRSDIPKHGTAVKLWRDGPTLKGDFENVDDDLALAIKAGKFDDVSAEIYDEPPEGVPGKGKMFRRLAILGGDIPHVKGLNQGGLTARLAAFRERPRVKITRLTRRSGVYTAFSEDVPMQRDEMIQALQAAGLDPDVLNGMDDRQLGEMMKLQQGAQGGGQQTETDPGAAATAIPAEGQGEGAEAGESQPTPAPDDAGATEDDQGEQQQPSRFDEMMPDKDGAAAAFHEFCGAYKKKFGEEFSPAPVPGRDQSAPPANTFSELKTFIRNTIQAEFNPLRGQVTGLKSEARRERVRIFCEEQLRAGRISAAELDDTAGPTLADRLLALDDKTVVHKFNEGGREKALTQLDAEMRAIRTRPPLYKGEQVKAGQKGLAKFAEGSGSKEGRKEKVMKFAEDSGDLAKIGMTAKEFVSAWEAGDESAKQELESAIGF